jgi:hypothetical protein
MSFGEFAGMVNLKHDRKVGCTCCLGVFALASLPIWWMEWEFLCSITNRVRCLFMCMDVIHIVLQATGIFALASLPIWSENSCALSKTAFSIYLCVWIWYILYYIMNTQIWHCECLGNIDRNVMIMEYSLFMFLQMYASGVHLAGLVSKGHRCLYFLM